MKRTFDLLATTIGLCLCWPLLVAVALLVKLDSPGPILFTQMRVGRGFRPFLIYKFRTMVQDAPSKGGQLTIGQDARITRAGRFLRRYKLDELPQLFNVLKGDMSLVGPRPEVPRYVELFREEYLKILTVRPGLTDLASIQYIDEAAVLDHADNPEDEYRNVILPEKIRLAKLYVLHASLLFDLAIVAQTLLCLLGVRLIVCELPELQPHLKGSQESYGIMTLSLIMKWRRPLIVILDIGLMILANYLAFWLRFDGDIPSQEAQLFQQTIPWLVAFRAAAFFFFRLNEGLWRYTSIWDLQNIFSAILTSTIAFFCWVQWGIGVTGYPRSIFIIDSLLLVGLTTGIRLPRRLFREKVIYRKTKKVLIIGAGDSGDSGERIVREMRMHTSHRYHPIGFIGDQESLVGQRIHGVKVLGTRKDLSRIVMEEEPQEIVLALPEADPVILREILAALGPSKAVIKTLPSVRELLANKSVVSQIRTVSLADLLPRAPVDCDADTLRQMVKGKRVLITGAGGSIGSELCRQIAALHPEALLLYERHENSLYIIAKELEDHGWSSFVHPVIGDITDVRRLSSILDKHRPHILFHAAAHKHVPLVELNPDEALKNNCVGTRIVAEAADRYGVERFVLISTDKAVNPSSVMGATKRVAELIVQDMARRSRTRFLTVRFGNVLGSNGSVVLRFQEQIQAGGPVTVTHPDVRRYFMLIPEAVHLVLQAASLAEQGAIYVLDMGEQIRVLDLARNLIRLSGYVPDQEIPIHFIGLRPGEKLDEELVGEGEIAKPSAANKIRRIETVVSSDLRPFDEKLIALEAAATLSNSAWGMERLRELVPTFRAEGCPASLPDQAAGDALDQQAALQENP
jgi:FlaA1/EpsC-like NDP-sugar epimerase/lipopolysaccharide/colanic/teichoic acid biosynthesis glycosyltransferase